MPPILQYNTKSQKEAYLNEFKGNLFEFLVGSFLARTKGVEGTFLKSFSPQLRGQFSFYELQLKKEDLGLVQNISQLAQNMGEALLPFVPSKIDNVLVVGKSPGLERFKEADLIIIHGKDYVPISLKLCKENSFVNTKSGGVKSFLSKYFSSFSECQGEQNKLDESVQKGFLNMGHALHDYYDLDFKGKFGESWKKEVGIDLPGELPENLKIPLLKFYYQVIASIYDSFLRFEKERPDLFKLSLYPLLGFGLPNMIQGVCYHGIHESRGLEKKRYALKGISIRSFEQVRSEIDQLSIGELKSKLSSFEIDLPSYRFQIRVKPMNKFIAPSLKVNCSIREKRK
jgi:hypothetical protein